MFKRILVPVDGSAPSTHALAIAAGLAKANAGQLRLVHMLDQSALFAVPDPMGGATGQLFESLRQGARDALEAARAAARAAGVEADTLLLAEPGTRLGEAVAAAATQWQADLIVVGTHGRSGPSRLLLGSGAEQVIRLAPVPVLVTRVPGED